MGGKREREREGSRRYATIVCAESLKYSDQQMCTVLEIVCESERGVEERSE